LKSISEVSCCLQQLDVLLTNSWNIAFIPELSIISKYPCKISSATFSGEAYFHSAKFSGEKGELFQAEFSGEAGFHGATFSKISNKWCVLQCSRSTEPRSNNKISSYITPLFSLYLAGGFNRIIEDKEIRVGISKTHNM
jgi:hypothetical protein